MGVHSKPSTTLTTCNLEWSLAKTSTTCLISGSYSIGSSPVRSQLFETPRDEESSESILSSGMLSLKRWLYSVLLLTPILLHKPARLSSLSSRASSNLDQKKLAPTFSLIFSMV